VVNKIKTFFVVDIRQEVSVFPVSVCLSVCSISQTVFVNFGMARLCDKRWL